MSYQFNDNGNLISRSDGATLHYDDNNRLIQFQKGATTANYKYEPGGRRISKTVNGQTTWYLWDQAQLISEYDSSGQRQKRYTYLQGRYNPIRMEDAHGAYEVHADHLDTPKLLTDASQQIVWRATMEAFGKATVEEDVDGNEVGIEFNVRFPGQYYDAESGLYYNYLRYYDPQVRRFITADPIGLKAGTNLYSYGLNNPVRYIDPLGLDVYICGRPADLPFPLNQLNHEWLLTDTAEAGMGAAGGGVPAQNGNSDLPGVPVEVVDHTGQSTEENSHCDHVENVDESCVNKKITIGRSLGHFGPTNNCQTFVMEVVIECSSKKK